MTTRKEERERLRQERLAAQKAASSSEQRRLYLGYAVAGVIVVAIVAGIVVAIAGGGDSGSEADSSSDFPELAYIQPLIGAVPDGVEPDGRDGTDPPPLGIGDLEEAAEVAGCDLQLNLPDEGNTHFTNEDKDQQYDTNPPTSGDHYFNPTETGSGALADGAYLNTPPMVRAVHSLEHGRVLIQYSPDLSEEEQLEIKGVFEESPQGVQMFPNPDMPYEVAATAWRQLVGCDEYSPEALDVLRDFRDIYRGNGPENVPLAVSG
jgi:Protein of unknown function (DUF3105)